MSETNKLTTPAVQSNISLNLNQNDLIELAIQTKLEEQELLLENLKQQINDKRKELEELNQDYNKSIHQLVLKLKDVQYFMNTAEKIFSSKVEPHFTNDKYPVTETLVSKTFLSHESVRNCEDHKNPVQYFKRYIHNSTFTTHLYKDVFYSIGLEKNNIYMSYKVKFIVPKALNDKYRQKFVKQLEEIANVEQAYSESYESYLNLKYDDKKIKARFIKTALSKSVDGKKILSLLDDVSSVKLIG